MTEDEPQAKRNVDRPAFVPYSLDEFLHGKSMWAANYFVLWPLGLALTATIEVLPVEEAKFCGLERTHDAHLYHATDLGPAGDGAECAGTVRGSVVSLGVREWHYPEGEPAETIDQSHGENKADFRAFASYARDRLMAMSPKERKVALDRLENVNIFTAETLLCAD